jgi:hypothetical protein
MKEKLQHQILVIVDMSLYKRFRRKMLTNNDKFASVVIRKLMRQYIDSWGNYEIFIYFFDRVARLCIEPI